ncbi:peptidoglycan DD-metalloendopeptidase family protein [Thalassobius sp. I31.1]|uniref:murein hydrolase activator EnvC family protein n=1 Tax=Thalassobius sp. I31.1 TaxID=2109912 RepID=UPI000D19BB70|nr:peptidoglycan DD-metalloendopeptidase family protein [Thalassobius sp. I31.1]
MWVRGFIYAALLALSGQAIAQSDPKITAQRAALQLDTAATALIQAENATDRVKALTETVAAYEEGLIALRQGIRQVAVRESALRQIFDARSLEISRLLAALQAMERSPAPLLMLHPSGPAGTARSSMMLAEVTPALQVQAESLKRQIDELNLLQAIQTGAADALREGLAGVQTARARLSEARADRIDLPRQFSADPEAMQALLNNSETLRAFADGLNSLPEGSSLSGGYGRLEDLIGALALPVNGTLLRGYNEPDAAGITRPGIVLATMPEALVTSPVAATIRYAGPLLDYGNVIILEPDNQHLLVLAGLGAVYSQPGEIVQPGTALGLMSGETTLGAVSPFSTDGTGAERSETLYIELRQGDSPTDPSPWFDPGSGN